MKIVLMMPLIGLILASCQTTKLSNLENRNLCLFAYNSNIAYTITEKEAELIKEYFSEPTKFKLKYPQLAEQVLGCIEDGDS